MEKITYPPITHKYITLFDDEGGYNTSYPNFEEVNWSDIDYPEERPEDYRLSRRLSNMYHKDNPPQYKFDDINDIVIEGDTTIEEPYTPDNILFGIIAEAQNKIYHPDSFKIATYNSLDDIRKTFFLEIVWGYYGWEWLLYLRTRKNLETGEDEPYGEPILGGNLYKIKEIENVPSIIDGNRLYHINDFLNSLDKVINVEGFDTSNLITANRAFKRITTPTRRSNTIPTLFLLNAYDLNNNIKYHYFGYGNTLNKLEEADLLFYNGKVYIIDLNYEDLTINIPNITHIDRLFSYGYLPNLLKFNTPKLEELTHAFRLAIVPRSIINVNEIFIGDSLKHVKDLSYMFMGASLTGFELTENGNETKVILDLTNSSVPLSDTINLTRFLGWSGNKEYGVSGSNNIIENTILDVDLNFNNKVNLNEAFADIMRNKNLKVADLNEFDLFQRNGGFLKLHINIHNKERFITSIVGGFYNNLFIEPNPILLVPNNECDDKYIYRYCTFNEPVTYNFKNGELSSPRLLGYGLFNDVTFNNTYHLENVDALDRVEFYNVKFGSDVQQEDRAFPYIVQNLNDHTYRYFDLRNSKFNSIPNQDIYIDSIRFRKKTNDKLGTAAEMNPFAGCTEFTDLSNIHLYYSDIDERVKTELVKTDGISLTFNGCTKLTKTPHIHFKYWRNWNIYTTINFSSLRYLTEVNFEDFSFRGGSNASWNPLNFKDCTSLVYLKIATNTEDGFTATLNMDIRGCVSLDIPTLKQTLLKINNGKLTCLKSTWEKVNDYDLVNGEIVSYFKRKGIGYEYIEDSSYIFPSWYENEESNS